jgi:hypothetical protein
MNRIVFLLVLTGTLLFAGLGQAATVYVDARNNGVFYLMGSDFQDIGGVEIELSYDTNALTNPRITAGDLLSTTSFIPNPNYTKNKVKIAAVTLSPINGSGILAVVTFDLKGTAQGSVAISKKILAKSTTNDKGNKNPENPTDKPKDKPTDNDNNLAPPTDNNPPPTYLGGISMGTITLPQDQTAATTTTEKKTEYQPLVTDLRKDMTLPLPGAGTPQGGDKPETVVDAKPSDLPSVAYKSVLQMFKEFKGERSDKSLVALFAEAAYPGFKQDPPVALSDGVKTVKLTLKLKPSGNESPKFIMQGANVQQLRSEGEEFLWIVEAVPKKGVSDAHLTVIDGKRTLVFPLTVAPLVNTAVSGGGKTTAADFARYLTKPAKYDLNQDGKFDYVDDYIYTANYILAMKIKPEKQAVKAGKEPAKADKKEGQKVAPVPRQDEKNDTRQPEKKPTTPVAN